MLRWVGDFMRMDEDKIPKQVLTMQLDGKRKRDNLKLWFYDVSNDAKLFGLRHWRAVSYTHLDVYKRQI